MKKYTILLLLPLVLLTASCSKILGEGPENDPAANLESFYTTFKEQYGMFKLKQIDWDSAYAVNKTLAGPDASEQELYTALVNMIKPLNDNHITLYPNGSGLPNWSADLQNGYYVDETFHFETIREHYLSGYRMLNAGMEAGMLEGNIAYLHLINFDGQKGDYTKDLRQYVEQIRDSKGLVIDIRDNGGGYDPFSQIAASYFTAQEKVYMRSRKKTGPGPDDFSAEYVWNTSPAGITYTKPIVLLTGKGTASAAETFSLAMLTQAHVIHVGDTTSGAFSDAVMKELPNGWMYTLSIGDYRDGNGVSHEGTGLLPQYPVTSVKTELDAGQDRALDKAIELLK